jgi:hypothetical protein
MSTSADAPVDTQTIILWCRWNISFYSTKLSRPQSDYWLAGDRRNHMFIVQNGCRPWLEGNPYVDEEGSDEELEEGYFDEQYSKEGEPTVAELWEARHDDDHYFTFNHEEDMDMSPCGDTESTQICFSEDFQSAVPFLEFVERHGCRVEVADEEFSPSEGERIRFTAAFREEQRGRAVFSGGCVEKRNEFSVEVPKKAGEDLDYSRLQFFVHRVWSNNIHHYTDYIMAVGYDDETYDSYWECDCSEEAWHDITPVESHVSYRFVAGACINRWAKGVLARRRARLLRVWRTVLRGSTRVADRATGDPTAAEEVGAAEAEAAVAALTIEKEDLVAADKGGDGHGDGGGGVGGGAEGARGSANDLWKMGARGTQLVAAFLGVD